MSQMWQQQKQLRDHILRQDHIHQQLQRKKREEREQQQQQPQREQQQEQHVDARMFRPVPSMKSARLSSKHMIEKVFPDGFWAETKFDGWRIQLHKTGDVVKLYTRSGLDYTGTFASVVHEIITRNLITVDKCIVDGEILVWDTDRKEAGPIESLIPVAMQTHDRMHQSKSIIVIRLWDVLRINDKQLMDTPLHERRRRLHTIVKTSDVLQVVSPIKLNSKVLLHTWNEMVHLLKQKVGRREEGLVLKSPSSTYQPGERRLGFWVKVKPDYFDHGTIEHDLLIVGATSGKGTSIDQYVVAIAEDPSRSDGKPSCFHSFAHACGMTRDERAAVQSILTKYMVAVDFKKKNIDTHNTKAVKFTRRTQGVRKYVEAMWVADALNPSVRVMYSGGTTEGCDWVIDPRRSIIVTLKADYRSSISHDFAMNPTLKFPRIHEKGLRTHRPDKGIHGDEKPWYDCMLCSEWATMVGESSDDTTFEAAALNPNRFDRISDRRNAGKPPVATAPVAPLRVYNGGGVKRSNMLSNYIIHVQRCEASMLKELEEAATELGAQVYSADPSSGKSPLLTPGKTSIRIGTNNTSQAFVTCKKQDLDVVKDIWLRDCYAMEALDPEAVPPELQPKYMFNTSVALKEVFNSKFDIFGDSYTEPLASAEQLDEILNNNENWEEMSMHSDGDLSDGQVRAVESDLLSDGEDLAWSVFSGVVAQLVSLDPSDGMQLALARGRLIAGGAMISPSNDHAYAVTHIVVVGSLVGDPKQSPDWLSAECMATVRAVLPPTEPYNHKRRRAQTLATDWVVVSTAWVESERERLYKMQK
jgi:DNA ligase-4